MILRPEDFTHQTIQVNDLRMHLVSEGAEDAPLIVLLHGFPEFWYSWRHQIKPLAAAGYRVVAVDQRGYNLTDKHGPYDIFTLSDDIAGLIRALGYQKAAAVIGHDWGGVVTWTFGARHANMLEKLIVCNVPHISAGIAAFSRLYLPQIMKSWYMFFFQLPSLPERLIAANDYKLFADVIQEQTKGAVTDTEIAYFKQAWAQPGALFASVSWYRALFQSTSKIAQTDMNVYVPSLLIWGDQDSALTTTTAEWSRRYVQDFTLRAVLGVSHWVEQEAPEIVTRYILDFLSEAR